MHDQDNFGMFLLFEVAFITILVFFCLVIASSWMWLCISTAVLLILYFVYEVSTVFLQMKWLHGLFSAIIWPW